MPATPAYAVIFASQRTAGDNDYAEAAAELARLAETMPGYLGAHSVREAGGAGITVSYWESPEAIAAWRDHPVHVAARRRMDEWYASWSLTVCRVERAKTRHATDQKQGATGQTGANAAD